MRTRILKVQVFRNHPPLHRKYCLDQSRNSGSWLQVTDVGLHRADQKRTICFASLAVNCGRCLNFDRIAQLRRTPVCFQIIHF